MAVDSEQLADFVLALVADPERRRAMGDAGRAKVRARFRASAVIRE